MKLNHFIDKARAVLPLITSRHRHISFIVDGNKIVSTGYAQLFKTHPLAKKYGHRFSCIHSELHAIKNFPGVPRELSRYVMINIRFLANGTVGMAKPCIRCQKMLGDFGIKRIYFTTKREKFERFV